MRRNSCLAGANQKGNRCATDVFQAAFESGLKKFAVEFGLDKTAEAAEKAVESIANDALLPLKVIEMGARALDTIFNWDSAFASAEKLMTLSVMDAQMDILGASKNGENYQYYAQLWALLQAKGDEHAMQMLDEWNKGTALSMEDFGIKSDQKRKAAKADISAEHDRYRKLLETLGWEGSIKVLNIWENE